MLKKTMMAITLALSGATAQAVPITFTFEGVGDLGLDYSYHAATAFTVTINADTDNVHPPAFYAPGYELFYYEPVSAALDLGTLGSGMFNYPMYVFNTYDSSSNLNIAGFGIGPTPSGPTDPTDPFGDLFGIMSPNLRSYEMISSFDSISGTPFEPKNGLDQQWIDVTTSFGITSFRNFTSSTFSATMGDVSVPEPGVLALIAIGIAARFKSGYHQGAVIARCLPLNAFN